MFLKYKIQDAFGQAIRDFTFNQRHYLEYIFFAIGPVILLFTISKEVAIISLLLSLINILIVEKINRAIEAIMSDIKESYHKFTARLFDFVGNVTTIISLKLGKKTREELDKKFLDYYRDSMREHNKNQLRCFVLSFGLIAIELTIILYYLWTHKVAQSTIMVGNLVMIVNYYRQMSDAFRNLMSSFYNTLDWKTSIESVNPVIQASKKYNREQDNNELINENRSKDNNKGNRINKTWSSLSIKNLSFQYDKNKAALLDIELNLNRDSKIALVGLSGSGKSTLLKIIAGLYQTEQLSLTIDKKNYEDLSFLSDKSLLISRDSEIFENTIYNNITFDLNNGEKELAQIIKMSCLKDLIAELPDGINTDIREKGVNLSGGEKQRLALARGLYFSRNKEILY